MALDPDLRKVMKRLAAVDKRIQVYDEPPPPVQRDESVFDISKFVWQRKRQSSEALENPLLMGNFLSSGEQTVPNWSH